MKLLIRYLGETKGENVIHILTSEESVDTLLEHLIRKVIPPIFHNSTREKFARIHQVRKVELVLSNYLFIVELLPILQAKKTR